MSNGVRRTQAAGLKASAGSNVSKRYKRLSVKYKSQGSMPGDLMKAAQKAMGQYQNKQSFQKQKPSGGSPNMSGIIDQFRKMKPNGFKPDAGTGFGRKPIIKKPRPGMKPLQPGRPGISDLLNRKPFQKPKIRTLEMRYDKNGGPAKGYGGKGMQLARRKSVKRKSVGGVLKGAAKGAAANVKGYGRRLRGEYEGAIKGYAGAVKGGVAGFRNSKPGLRGAGQRVSALARTGVKGAAAGARAIAAPVTAVFNRNRRGIKKFGQAAGAAAGAMQGVSAAFGRSKNSPARLREIQKGVGKTRARTVDSWNRSQVVQAPDPSKRLRRKGSK